MNKQPEETTALLEHGFTIGVHNHGFVRYIDHMGSDRAIVEAARVSYGSPMRSEEEDKKLLRYLFTHKHTSPFEMAKVKFNVRVPIFVMRQYIRHRMQNVNEESARYKELRDDFFLPDRWRAQDTKNKQSSLETEQIEQDIASDLAKGAYKVAYQCYTELLQMGVAREQARMVLPVGIYTEFYCCWDLNNLIKYFTLRDDPHAQAEHQDYARAMKQICAKLFPWTMEVYEQRASTKS